MFLYVLYWLSIRLLIAAALVIIPLLIWIFFVGFPLPVMKWLWEIGFLRWRYVMIDEFDENYCEYCGQRLYMYYDKAYSPNNGKVKRVVAHVRCRRGYDHMGFDVDVPPSDCSKPIHY